MKKFKNCSVKNICECFTLQFINLNFFKYFSNGLKNLFFINTTKKDDMSLTVLEL